MKYIAHRINTIEKLIQTPIEFGVELDLRDYGDKLVLEHDPFVGGEEFEEYLKYYKHGTMILNIKSDIRYVIDQRFRENGIKIPFPQRVIWSGKD